VISSVESELRSTPDIKSNKRWFPWFRGG